MRNNTSAEYNSNAHAKINNCLKKYSLGISKNNISVENNSDGSRDKNINIGNNSSGTS